MYVTVAVILIAIVLVARVAQHWRLPLVVIALGVGIIFGSDITGLVYFDNAGVAKQFADLALIFVLFNGGFGTRSAVLRTVLIPSVALATLGVLVTALVAGIALHLLLGLDIIHSLLLGCIISSTDAAAVFSILRSRSLANKVSSIAEIESASNDPMAIILTTIAVQIATPGMHFSASTGLAFFWQLLGGAGIGLLIGKVGCFLLNHIKILDKGYFYICVVGIISFSYGVADTFNTSGMLSVFFAGYVLGNSGIPYKKTLASFAESLSTISNVAIFVILGLLVFPREFGAVWLEGLLLFIVLTFLARPIAVAICTAISRIQLREQVLISWCGLRGAVPIVLATYPVAAGIESAREIFNIVFIAVALSMLVQGTTITKLADWLKLTTKSKPRPRQVMELTTVHPNNLELCEIMIDDELYEGAVTVSSFRLPEGTTITMINRNETIIAPQGSTVILPGDVLYLLVKAGNVDLATSEIFHKFSRLQ